MANTATPQMPADWNDHAGWDSYFAAKLAPPPGPLDDFLGSIPTPHLLQLTANYVQNNQRAVWVPGCGITPLPRQLAYRGLEVVATTFRRSQSDFRSKPRVNLIARFPTSAREFPVDH